MTAHRQKDRTPAPSAQKSPQVGWLDSMASSVAAAFGVQSHKNRVRDFEHGDIRKFVISGITLTLLILFSLIGVVQFVLHSAQ